MDESLGAFLTIAICRLQQCRAGTFPHEHRCHQQQNQVATGKHPAQTTCLDKE